MRRANSSSSRSANDDDEVRTAPRVAPSGRKRTAGAAAAAAAGEEPAVASKRPRTGLPADGVDLTLSTRDVEHKFGLRAVDVVSVPDLPELLDQVTAASGPTLYGARVDFSWETDPGWIRDRLRDEFDDANRQRDADAAQLRESGAQVPRRSRFFDDVTAPDEPTERHERLSQAWRSRRAPRRRHRGDGAASAAASDGVDTPRVLHRTATHQIVKRARVTLSSRSASDRTHATSSYLHDLHVRLEAGSAERVVEVHYILEEGLVNAMSEGPFSFREGCVTSGFNKFGTWLDDIPDAISMPGIEQEDYRKAIELSLPGASEASATTRDDRALEDLLVLRQALRFHGGVGADVAGVGTGDAKWQLVGVTMTRGFKRAVEVSSATLVGEHHHHQLRWLQLTPFGGDAWRTDNVHGDLDDFYSDSDDSDDEDSSG